MSALARYIVDAIVLERRSPSQLAHDHDISRSWIYRLLERFREGGYEALEPRSRRPHPCSRQAGPEVQAEIVRLRTELIEAGHDGGSQTILYHLADRVEELPSAATVWRVLKRYGLITPQPQKRPKSSFIPFEAKLPNETWQVDATPWQLADGRQVEILNFLDDHSRLHLAVRAFSTIRASDVVETFHAAAREFDLPASVLSDNAAVFTGRSRRGKVLLEHELARLGIQHKHSSPYHPQTLSGVGEPPRLHVAAGWNVEDVETVEQLANPLTLRAPDGSLTTALGLAPAPGSPLDGSLLLLRAQPYPRLNNDVPLRLLFTGGFPATIGDADQESSMLVLHYPADEVQSHPSIDYTPNAEPVTLAIEEPGSSLS